MMIRSQRRNYLFWNSNTLGSPLASKIPGSGKLPWIRSKRSQLGNIACKSTFFNKKFMKKYERYRGVSIVREYAKLSVRKVLSLMGLTCQRVRYFARHTSFSCAFRFAYVANGVNTERFPELPPTLSTSKKKTRT